MPFVEILKLQNDGSQTVLATCKLTGGGVICEGDENFVANLNSGGIRDYSSDSGQNLFPKDGLKFLEQLRYNFKSGYLNATDIKE